MDAPKRPEVCAERRACSFAGVAVDLGLAVSILIPRPLAPTVADGDRSRVAPPVALPRVGREPRAASGDIRRDQCRAWARAPMALPSLSIGDVLAEVDDLTGSEPDPEQYPWYSLVAHTLDRTSMPGQVGEPQGVEGLAMERQAVQILARILMNEHGLREWTFAFDRATSCIGCAHLHLKRITLSAPITRLNDVTVIRNTLLHEIAPARCPPGTGHGRVWRATARAIGCTAERCSAGIIRPRLKCVGICPHCRAQYQRHKRVTGWCRACGVRKTQENRLVWKSVEGEHTYRAQGVLPPAK